MTGDVTIDGKLCIEGKLVVDPTATLIITEDAVIVGPENIEYKTCDGGEDCFSKMCIRDSHCSTMQRWSRRLFACKIAKFSSV